jgi:hydroxymethylbilane synthase
MLGELSDKQVMYQVIAERSFLKIMEGGCQVPVGTFSEIKGDEITLHAMIGSLDGKKVIKNNMKDSISKAEDLGRRLGKDLLERGGRKILESIRTN